MNILTDRIPDSYEVRSFSEVRADAELGTFTGHASAWKAVDSYATTFDRKAFNKTIADKEGRIPVLFFHDPKEMVGPARTLKPDGTGLYHESKAVEDGRTGSYVLAHMRGGTQMGMSHGFRTRKDRAATEADGLDLSTAPEGITLEDVRVITEVELFEISVLPWTFASNPKADVASVRAVQAADALSTLLESTCAGTLTDEQAAQIESLVAAYQTRAGAGDTHSTPEDQAQAQTFDLLAAAALVRARQIIGV